MESANERVSDVVMGRFFVAAQDLIMRGEISMHAVAVLRNALYGPSVEPLSAEDFPRMMRELHLPTRQRRWKWWLFRVLGPFL